MCTLQSLIWLILGGGWGVPMSEHDETRDRANRILEALTKARKASKNASDAISELNAARYDAGILAQKEGESGMANELLGLSGLGNDLASNIGEFDEALAKIWDTPAFGQLELDSQYGTPSPPSARE